MTTRCKLRRTEGGDAVKPPDIVERGTPQGFPVHIVDCHKETECYTLELVFDKGDL